MSSSRPLVTLMIATRNRPKELEDTLLQLRRQDYVPSEALVIDDASELPIEPIVRKHFPSARYLRHETNAGQCQRRTEAFELAGGKYIFQLDDDAAPVNRGDLRAAVDFLERNPRIGVLSFYIFNGSELPSEPLSAAEPKYAASFVGCSALIRKEAVSQTGGYQPFFENEWEEEELGLRLLKAGWGLYFYSPVAIHHKVTHTNRRSDRTWMRGLRNKLWSHVMHLPLWRLPLELTWTLAIACWDAVRLLRFHRLVQALSLFLIGLPRAVRLRQPMGSLALRRYDALRFKAIRSPEEFENPPHVALPDLWRWFTKSWLSRPRQRSVWDRAGAGGVGRCDTVRFEHEYTADSKRD